MKKICEGCPEDLTGSHPSRRFCNECAHRKQAERYRIWAAEARKVEKEKKARKAANYDDLEGLKNSGYF